MERLYDMHCHLGSMANPDLVADQAEQMGIAFLNVTVSPADADRCRSLGSHPNVYLASGLHPWWVANGTCGEPDIARAAALCASSRFVGEVGLDYSGAHAASALQQQAAFEWIVQACAERPVEGRVLSIHAVKAADDVLDALQRFDLAHDAACIFHWFSGTSDEFARARKLGCYFSVNERVLSSKRGREYARQVPLDKLLLETDAPREFGKSSSGSEVAKSLLATIDALAAVRTESAGELRSRIARTSEKLLF